MKRSNFLHLIEQVEQQNQTNVNSFRRLDMLKSHESRTLRSGVPRQRQIVGSGSDVSWIRYIRPYKIESRENEPLSHAQIAQDVISA